MTSVPVVSTQLNTRTVREGRRAESEAWAPIYTDPSTATWTDLLATFPSLFRERLTADPVFVVLPEAPDLTCRNPRCDDGRVWYGSGDNEGAEPCESCGGSGVSPVYAATPKRVWLDGVPFVWDEPRAPGGVWDKVDQVVEWRARRVEPLPVVDKVGAWAYPCIQIREGRAWRWTSDQTDTAIDVTDKLTTLPEPGMCVLRLSEWEHLEQPYTEMPTSCDGYCTQAICPNFVPLSVPDGVLSWIELA